MQCKTEATQYSNDLSKTKVARTAIRIKDPVKSLDFYTRILGMRCAHTSTDHSISQYQMDGRHHLDRALRVIREVCTAYGAKMEGATCNCVSDVESLMYYWPCM